MKISLLTLYFDRIGKLTYSDGKPFQTLNYFEKQTLLPTTEKYNQKFHFRFKIDFGLLNRLL